MENPIETGKLEGRLEQFQPGVDHRPQVIVVEPRRGVLDVVSRVLAGVAMVVIILMLAALLTIMAGLSGALNAANSSISNASNAVQQASSALQGPIQGLLGQVQPDRPPPSQVSQGPEFSQFERVPAGEPVGQSSTYVLTVSRVVKRDGASDPNQSQYAVLHRKLMTPRPRTVGPIQVGEDYDEADYTVYKGENFRLGAAIYQVNWVSVQDNAVGIVRFRNSDAVAGPIKFQVN